MYLSLSLCFEAVFYLLIAYFAYNVYLMVKLKWIFKDVPAPPTNPVLGLLKELVAFSTEQLFQYQRDCFKKYGDVYVLWVLHWPAIFLKNADDIEVVLSSTKHIEKSEIYLWLYPWLKEGLLISGGKKWQHRRKILTPAFHFNILQQFMKTFISVGENIVEKLKTETNKSQTNISPYICDSTLKAVCETALGINLENTPGQEEYRALIYKLGKLIVYLVVRPWYGTFVRFLLKPFYDFISTSNQLNVFTKYCIRQREVNFKPSDVPQEDEVFVFKRKRNLAMLDLLLLAKHEGKIDDAGILEEVNTFTFEGHDTTAANLIFTLMLLANHKEVQDKAYQEIQEEIKDGDEISYQSIQNLNYLDNVIKESLRICPSVPFISRKAAEDFTIPSGYRIPKGAIVNILIYDVHRDERHFKDPEKFDPDRFLPDNIAGRHPYCYIPFSAGPRNCIGQRFALLEVKTILCHILREFELLPVDNQESLTFITDIILRNKQGVKLKFVPRKKVL